MSKPLSNEKFLDEQVANYADSLQRKTIPVVYLRNQDEIRGLVETMLTLHEISHSIHSTKSQKRHILKSAKNAWTKRIGESQVAPKSSSPSSTPSFRLNFLVRGIAYALATALLLLAGIFVLDRLGRLNGRELPGMAAGSDLFYIFLIVGGGLLIALIIFRDKK